MILRLHLQQRPLRRIHRRLPQRVRVHLAEALVAVDGDAFLAGGDEELDEVVERFDLDVLARPFVAALAAAGIALASGLRLGRELRGFVERRAADRRLVRGRLPGVVNDSRPA